MERERRRRRAVRFVVGAEQIGEEVLRKFSDRSLDNRFICRTPLASRQFCIRNQIGLVGLFGRHGLSIFQILILKYGRSIFGDSLNASLLLLLFGLLLLSNAKKIPCPYGISTKSLIRYSIYGVAMVFQQINSVLEMIHYANESFIEAFFN